MKKAIVVAGLLSLGLAACQTTGPLYAPARDPRSPGFSDMRVEQNRFRVTYRGPAGAPPALVDDLALLRAADIAVAEGYDWFRVTNRYTEANRSGGPTLSLGTGGVDFGRRSAVGIGIGTSFDLGGGPSRVVTLEVLMARGAKPAERDAYDAADVQRTIRSRLPA